MDIAEAPPVADEARLCRGSGAIGGHKVPGNRIAATVKHFLEPKRRQWRMKRCRRQNKQGAFQAGLQLAGLSGTGNRLT